MANIFFLFVSDLAYGPLVHTKFGIAHLTKISPLQNFINIPNFIFPYAYFSCLILTYTHTLMYSHS